MLLSPGACETSQSLAEWILERARLLGANRDPVAFAVFANKVRNTRLCVLRAIVDGQVISLVKWDDSRVRGGAR